MISWGQYLNNLKTSRDQLSGYLKMAGGNLLHDKNGNVLSSKHLPKNSTSHISLFWKLWLSLTIITFPLLDNKNKQNTNTKQPELNIQLGDLEQQKRRGSPLRQPAELNSSALPPPPKARLRSCGSACGMVYFCYEY